MNDKTLRLILGIVRSAIIAIGAILLISIANNSGTDETFSEGIERYGATLDLVYTLTLVALLICAAAAVLFGLVFFLTNIKQRLATLGGVIVFGGLALISFYVLADDTVLRAYESSGISVSPEESRFAGGGMYLVYLLGGGAILAIIWAEVSRIFK
jgi:hypothetical protein